eukprot:scaffold20903_cov99-Isochrysis_galbana.AAC.3
MAVGPPKHVLLLRHHAVGIAAAGAVRVGHVEAGEGGAVLARHLQGNHAPVAREHDHLAGDLGRRRLLGRSLRPSTPGRGLPSQPVLLREHVESSRGAGFLEGAQRLQQYLLPHTVVAGEQLSVSRQRAAKVAHAKLARCAAEAGAADDGPRLAGD